VAPITRFTAELRSDPRYRCAENVKICRGDTAAVEWRALASYEKARRRRMRRLATHKNLGFLGVAHVAKAMEGFFHGKLDSVSGG
jgi:hypothetical protein